MTYSLFLNLLFQSVSFALNVSAHSHKKQEWNLPAPYLSLSRLSQSLSANSWEVHRLSYWQRRDEYCFAHPEWNQRKNKMKNKI